MITVLLVIHLLIAMALVGVVLIQRSEGGALGGLGGSVGGVMTGRGAANFLTRTTAALATIFILTSLLLAIAASRSSGPSSILDGPNPFEQAPLQPLPTAPAAPAEPAAPVAN